MDDIEKKWIFHPGCDDAIESTDIAVNSKAIIIGPEGGFTLDEIVLAKQKKCMQKVLGQFILRTDTAVAVVLSYIKFGI